MVYIYIHVMEYKMLSILKIESVDIACLIVHSHFPLFNI